VIEVATAQRVKCSDRQLGIVILFARGASAWPKIIKLRSPKAQWVTTAT